jgi:Skp family chaperone for outer membrane proteins
MKTLRLIVVSMVCAAFLSVSAMAQASPAAKIALIDTQAFYDTTGGITKILNGYKRLQAELKPEADKYQGKITQFNTLKKSYDTLVAQAQEGKVPVKPEDVQSKQDQLTDLQTDIKRMQEDLKVKQDKREAEILGPIVKEVGNSIQDFAKQKGYTLVLDVGRMYNAQMLLFIDDKTDITKEFITFYNAKPAGTATK